MYFCRISKQHNPKYPLLKWKADVFGAQGEKFTAQYRTLKEAKECNRDRKILEIKTAKYTYKY